MAQSPAIPLPANYALVWSDEFDGFGLPDPEKWAFDTVRNQEGWYNNELQYYSEGRVENARVENGYLTITGRQERLMDAPDWQGQDYTSARLVTRDRASWTYGYFEMRARLPCGAGTWPAFWLLGVGEENWPASGEIDIMEQVGMAPDTIRATLFTEGGHGEGISATTTIADACTRFHTYHLLWEPDRITIGVNGATFFQYDNPGEGTSARPFDRPHTMLINLALGGDMAGPVDNGIFPVRHDIDYVWVFQRP